MKKVNCLSILTMMVVTMLMVFFTACSKDDDSPERKDFMTVISFVRLDGKMNVYQYTESGEMVGNHSFNIFWTGNNPSSFRVNSRATILKVYVEGHDRNGVAQKGWVQYVYYLDEYLYDESPQLTINEDVPLGPNEPSTVSTPSNNGFSIIGAWRKISDEAITTYTFNADGTGYKEKAYINTPSYSYKKSLVYSFDSSSRILEWYIDGKKESEIVTIVSNNQIIFDDDTFNRVN